MLEDLCVDPNVDHAETFPGLRANRPDNIAAKMLPVVRDFRAAPPGNPATAWPRIPFHPTFVTEPNLHAWVILQGAYLLQESLPE